MSERAPLGLKILVGFNVLGTVFSMFSAIFILILGSGMSSVAELGLILLPIIFVFGGLNLVLMYGLIKINQTAYYIVVTLYGLSLLSNLLAFQIIPLVITGICLGYLVIIGDKFRSTY